MKPREFWVEANPIDDAIHIATPIKPKLDQWQAQHMIHCREVLSTHLNTLSVDIKLKDMNLPHRIQIEAEKHQAEKLRCDIHIINDNGNSFCFGADFGREYAIKEIIEFILSNELNRCCPGGSMHIAGQIEKKFKA